MKKAPRKADDDFDSEEERAALESELKDKRQAKKTV